jgi:hypothetical protein
VLHRRVGVGDALGAFLVYFDVGVLSLEGDAVVSGVLLGNCNDAGVRPVKAWDRWRACKRRKSPCFGLSSSGS